MDRYFPILKSFVPSVFFIHQLVNCNQSKTRFRTLAWANGINFDVFLCFKQCFLFYRACVGESVAKMVAFMFAGNFLFAYEANCLDERENQREENLCQFQVLPPSLIGQKNPKYVDAVISFPEDFPVFVRRRTFN